MGLHNGLQLTLCYPSLGLQQRSTNKNPIWIKASIKLEFISRYLSMQLSKFKHETLLPCISICWFAWSEEVFEVFPGRTGRLVLLFNRCMTFWGRCSTFWSRCRLILWIPDKNKWTNNFRIEFNPQVWSQALQLRFYKEKSNHTSKLHLNSHLNVDKVKYKFLVFENFKSNDNPFSGNRH